MGHFALWLVVVRSYDGFLVVDFHSLPSLYLFSPRHSLPHLFVTVVLGGEELTCEAMLCCIVTTRGLRLTF